MPSLLELNAPPQPKNLFDKPPQVGKSCGVLIAIDTDAHSTGGLYLESLSSDGAGVEAKGVLKKLPLQVFRTWLKTNKKI